MIYPFLNDTKIKKLAVLIDPDKQNPEEAAHKAQLSEKYGADMILIGGSLVSQRPDESISAIKKVCKLPVLLFPGSLLQLTDKADALLLLSLISGRNPELLIGNHVNAAPIIKAQNINSIPTGYILIESGSSTAVEYISNTKAVPANKPDIAAATALAGELLGHKLIYLEAGSGAKNHVSEAVIKQVKQNINIPLFVGGGIRNETDLHAVCRAGADIIVIGTAFEKNPKKIAGFSEIIKSY